MRVLPACFVFFIYTTPLNAQTSPTALQQVDTASVALCKCFNTTFGSLDSAIQNLIKAVLINPDSGQQEIQHYLMHADEKRTREVTLQLLKMGSIDSDLTACFRAATQIFENVTDNTQNHTAEDQIMVENEYEKIKRYTTDLLLRKLAARSECIFAYQFIKLGLEFEKK